jgi:hypothetical protein
MQTGNNNRIVLTRAFEPLRVVLHYCKGFLFLDNTQRGGKLKHEPTAAKGIYKTA